MAAGTEGKNGPDLNFERPAAKQNADQNFERSSIYEGTKKMLF